MDDAKSASEIKSGMIGLNARKIGIHWAPIAPGWEARLIRMAEVGQIPAVWIDVRPARGDGQVCPRCLGMGGDCADCNGSGQVP